MATSSGTCSLSVLTCYLSVLLCFFQVLDILWSDPNKQHGCTPNQRRGGGCYFGPDTTDQLLKRYNLKMLIRSHEFKPDGYDLTHNGKVRGCHGKLVNFTGTSTVDLSAELIRNMSNFFKMGLGELCTKLIDVRTLVEFRQTQKSSGTLGSGDWLVIHQHQQNPWGQLCVYAAQRRS